MQVALKVVEGKQSGTIIPLTRKKFLIGREEDCQLRPNSDLVSRHHCAITVDEYSSVRIRDLGSTNGTYVNEVRLTTQVELKAGDKVRIGKLTFEVQIQSDAPTGQSAPVTRPAAATVAAPTPAAKPAAVPAPAPVATARPAPVPAAATVTAAEQETTTFAASGDPAGGETLADFRLPQYLQTAQAGQPQAPMPVQMPPGYPPQMPGYQPVPAGYGQPYPPQPGYGLPPGYPPQPGYGMPPGYPPVQAAPPGFYPAPGYIPQPGYPVPMGEPPTQFYTGDTAMLPGGVPQGGYMPQQGGGQKAPAPAPMPMRLPDPSETGAKSAPVGSGGAPTPAAADPAAAGGAAPPVDPKRSAADIIKQYMQRRPG